MELFGRDGAHGLNTVSYTHLDVYKRQALYLALHFTVSRTDAGGDVALYALIPAGIGAACLVYYFTVGRKVAAAMEEERKARMSDAAQLRNRPA